MTYRSTRGRVERAAFARGFTLIELTVALSISSILLMAVGSIIVLATKALPGPNDSNVLLLKSKPIATQIESDLQESVSINSASSTAIEFTVNDRDGDSNPETIRYEWSGTPGAALTRQYNGGIVHNVLDSVQEFGLTFFISTDSGVVAPPATGKLINVGVTLNLTANDSTRIVASTICLNRPGVTM